MQEIPNSLLRFKVLSLSTISAVYLLILVGGIVRSTGSGMGCPDWPKCFGSWVPPTSVEQLPSDYKEVYSQQRHEKNLRFAKYLEMFGMEETAAKIKSDPAIREEADFNPLKTWIEYLNRLLGVVIGLLIVGLFLYSVKLRNTYPVIFWLSVAVLVAVVFQGWIGSIVVSTNLLPGMISFHMLLALLIVVLLIVIYHKADRYSGSTIDLMFGLKVKGLLLICAVIYLLQLFKGIGVREGVDYLLQLGNERSQVLEMIGKNFYFHRSFSWLILIGHLLLVYWIWRAAKGSFANKVSALLAVLVFLEIVTGALMGYFAIPAFIQPIHLLIASLIFGFQVYLYLLVDRQKEFKNNP